MTSTIAMLTQDYITNTFVPASWLLKFDVSESNAFWVILLKETPQRLSLFIAIKHHDSGNPQLGFTH